MRIRGLAAASTATMVAVGAAAASVGAALGFGPFGTAAPTLAGYAVAAPEVTDPSGAGTVGLLPPAPRPARAPHAYTPPPPVRFELPPTLAPRLSPMPVALSELGIPELVLGAYRVAESTMAAEAPGCGVTWHLLAGIGRIESGHAGGGRTDAAGTTVTPILGPTLDGHLAGNNVITDTDDGSLDGDKKHDRAVGPMQFIPGTWARHAADGNGDGAADPNNIFDASLAAARYLCSGGLNLRESAQEVRAVLRYNNSMAYAANVLAWSAAYAGGGTPAPGSIPDIRPEPVESTSTPEPGRPVDGGRALDAAAPAAPGALAPAPAPLIPGLPELPCLIFCPPPGAAPAAPVAPPPPPVP
ncbi:lytic transglycosylase domain-containing protein [Rhodococcus sp. NPDC058514]|uniref:lytic transglycosylase domain-containing protein n=1 Tax=unclassified Rhodococcus (in: high G+C Gram-positive bacteria) TaxID=192944 RepID=UPI00364B09C5